MCPHSNRLRWPLNYKGSPKINQDIGDKDISAIPNSNEELMTFKIGDMNCIDFFFVQRPIVLKRHAMMTTIKAKDYVRVWCKEDEQPY